MELDVMVITIGSALIAVIAYFLKTIHSDVRRNTEEVGRNKGRIDQLNIQMTNEKEMRQVELKNLQENMQSNFTYLKEQMSELAKLIKDKK